MARASTTSRQTTSSTSANFSPGLFLFIPELLFFLSDSQSVSTHMLLPVAESATGRWPSTVRPLQQWPENSHLTQVIPIQGGSSYPMND